MEQQILEMIRQECEKIENNPGYGEVQIKIQDSGSVYTIRPTPTIMIKRKDIKNAT